MLVSAHCVRIAWPVAKVRPLLGIEVFQLIGWDFSYFTWPVQGTDALLRNMGGNAFSGFALMPMLMAGFAGLGTLASSPLPEGQTPKQRVDTDVDDDASSDDGTMPDSDISG